MTGLALSVLILAPALLALVAIGALVLLAHRLGQAPRDRRVAIWIGIVLLGGFAFAVTGCYTVAFFTGLH